MNVQDLDGNITSWKLVGHIVGINQRTSRSQYHLQARELLKKTYPTLQLLEEVPIVIRQNATLYLDFYFPLIKKAIEVHGEQHYKFIPFFHEHRIGFLRQLGRDRDKEEWCEINKIELIIFKYDKQDQWKIKL